MSSRTTNKALRAALSATYLEPYASVPAGSFVELGCGDSKIRSDAVGVDALPYPGVQVVGPIPQVLKEIGSNSVDIVYSSHFLEHVEDVSNLMEECERILRVGGSFVAVVPHFSNPYYYSDPTHRTPFGIYSMSYFATDRLHRRQVDAYSLLARQPFRLRRVELRFKATVRRPISFAVSTAIELLANRSHRFREFYERRLTWIWPCSELRFELVRT